MLENDNMGDPTACSSPAPSHPGQASKLNALISKLEGKMLISARRDGSRLESQLLRRQKQEDYKFEARLGHLVRLCLKLKLQEKDWRCSPVGEHLLSACEALGSIIYIYIYIKVISRMVLKSWIPSLENSRISLLQKLQLR